MNHGKILHAAFDTNTVTHGRWMSTIGKTCKMDKFESYQPITCSVCRTQSIEKYKYCPNCGSKMDL